MSADWCVGFSIFQSACLQLQVVFSVTSVSLPNSFPQQLRAYSCVCKPFARLIIAFSTLLEELAYGHDDGGGGGDNDYIQLLSITGSIQLLGG